MPPIFWKNLHICFPTRLAIPKSEPLREPSSPPPPPVVTAKHFFTNFLYDVSSSTSTSKSLMTPSAATTDADVFSSSSSDSDAESPPLQPDFGALFASDRFFFSSPGRSNSIIESRDPRRESVELVTPPLGGGVAVKKLSPDPYSDFRSSMQEMIESRNLRDVKSEWEFLHELLLCYLNLNPTNTHQFIISAFADILVCLLLTSPSSTNSQHFQKQ